MSISQSFDDFKLNKQILNAISDLGFDTPTPIQRKTIPLALGGSDVMGVAQTGTGKTAAYVIPLLMKVKYAQGSYPRALILAPTRELAMQIAANIEDFKKYTDIRHTCIYGGVGPKTQIEEIKAGIDILIATPGRFIDLYKRGEIYVRDIKTMILDEADKMMDMGFMPQIRNVLEVIPVKRQNLLFSATMPNKVQDLSHEFLEFPEHIEITPQATTAKTVEQRFYKVPNFKTKINLLENLLMDESLFDRIIIFVKTKSTADNIFRFLSRKIEGEAKVIHGNKGQNTRINAIESFKNGEVRFLVATDVACRGLDVHMISHVINFDVPIVYEDYVHRIGRTGRANAQGTSITFVNESDEYHFRKIEKLIGKTVEEYDIPSEVTIESTPKEERKDISLAIDKQKRREDPTFKGAFHEKKKRNMRNTSKNKRHRKR